MISSKGHDRPRRQGGEPLASPHQLQVHVGVDGERLEHLLEHLAVLPGRHGGHAQPVVRFEPLDDRGELDHLRPGAEADHDLCGRHCSGPSPARVTGPSSASASGQQQAEVSAGSGHQRELRLPAPAGPVERRGDLDDPGSGAAQLQEQLDVDRETRLSDEVLAVELGHASEGRQAIGAVERGDLMELPQPSSQLEQRGDRVGGRHPPPGHPDHAPAWREI